MKKCVKFTPVELHILIQKEKKNNTYLPEELTSNFLKIANASS